MKKNTHHKFLIEKKSTMVNEHNVTLLEREKKIYTKPKRGYIRTGRKQHIWNKAYMADGKKILTSLYGAQIQDDNKKYD
jgi:hypothetical protein